MADMRTPLKTVRHLGSAKEGSDHFWRQRVTSVSTLLLTLFVLWLVAYFVVTGADYAQVRRMLANPLVNVGVILFIVSSVVHMRIGMQVIIEDYVHGEGSKVTLLMLNTFFSILVGAASIYALLKIGFGA